MRCDAMRCDSVGLPPFYSTDVQQMYTKILTAPLVLPETISAEAKSLLLALLERNPNRRLQEPKIIKAHPFFRGVDWDQMIEKEVEPPYVPPVKSKEEVTMVADEFKQQKVEFTYIENNLSEVEQRNFRGFTYVASDASKPQ
jgi:serine/threonine protein kinase